MRLHSPGFTGLDTASMPSSGPGQATVAEMQVVLRHGCLRSTVPSRCISPASQACILGFGFLLAGCSLPVLMSISRFSQLHGAVCWQLWQIHLRLAVCGMTAGCLGNVWRCRQDQAARHGAQAPDQPRPDPWATPEGWGGAGLFWAGTACAAYGDAMWGSSIPINPLQSASMFCPSNVSQSRAVSVHSSHWLTLRAMSVFCSSSAFSQDAITSTMLIG